MQTRIILLLGFGVLLACTMIRRQQRTKPAPLQRLSGWQKLFGVVAVVGAFLILLNPEMLALGLLGDTALFDALVLALSLQMHSYAVRVYHRCRVDLARAAKWMGIPSPGFRYTLAVSALTIAMFVSCFQKTAQRIFKS